MRAAVYYGPGDCRVEERPVADPADGEVLVRVRACGVCGTDLRITAGGHRAYPEGTVRVPGHEVAGVIAAIGAGVEAGLTVGTEVFVAPNIGCGRCRECHNGRPNLCRRPEAIGITRDGAFAEHVLVPADAVAQGNVVGVPRGADPAAIAMVEPLACVVRGQRPLEIDSEDLVLICGAGPIGLMHLALARQRQPAAIVVSEPSEVRRAQALARGADHVVDPGREDLAALLAELGEDGRGADVVITAAPAPAVQQQALEVAASGGRINFFGGLPSGSSTVALDTNLIHYKELLVTGTTANTGEDCREALDLVLAGAVDAAGLVSARFPLDGFDEALAAARGGATLKVVVEP